MCLPLTSVIETGNHISHVQGNREPAADALKEIIIKSSNGEYPWLVFDQQNGIWQQERLPILITTWNNEVKHQEHSLGDAIIVEIAKTYASNFDIEIFTGDQRLKEYERKFMGQKQKKALRRNRVK